MDEDVFQARLDFVQRKGDVAHRTDATLERGAIGPGHAYRAPEYRGRLNPGHPAQAPRSSVDVLAGRLKDNEPRLPRHILRAALHDDAAVGEIDDTRAPLGLVHVVGRN